MIEVFESVLTDMDTKGRALHGNGGWMRRVRAALSELEGEYPTLHQDGRDPIAYSGLPTQSAYVFAYAMPRAAFTFEFLKRHRRALGRPLFEGSDLTVVSFGGGPASELVGLLSYLGDEEFEETVEALEYRIYDKDGSWEEIADSVLESVETDIELTWSFEEVDLVNKEETQEIELGDVDLVIFSYIMSELCSLEQSDVIRANVNEVLTGLPSGSAILFIDSKYPKFIQYFQACKLMPGMRQSNDDGEAVNLDLPDLPPTFETFRNSLNRDPRMDGNIVSKLIVRA